MVKKHRVASSASTHFPNVEKVQVGDSEFEIENHQELGLLVDPEDDAAWNTHSSGGVAFTGPKKAPTTAALHDEERPKGGKIAEIDNAADPAAGYLAKEAGLPVINNAEVVEEDDEPEFVGSDLNDDDEFVEAGEDDEFADLPSIEADIDGMDDLEIGEPADEELDDELDADAEDEVAEEEFEADVPATDAIPLVDADEVPDEIEAEDCAFAVMSNAVHVIRANRIIASMAPASARKAGVSDVYLTTQFQDVVAHAIQTKGLRKGLVQSGFVLAKVKLNAAKATAKMVSARVESALQKRIEAQAQQEKAMEQSFAIAAVGINRHFFKGTNNELKAALETELTRMGMRGGSKMIRAMFAQYGVSYAQSILALAKKISAMPEEVRNQYADALDLTEDEDFDGEGDDEQTEDEYEEEDLDPIPTSMTAALARPAHRNVGALLKAGVKTTAAMSILSGEQSLI